MISSLIKLLSLALFLTACEPDTARTITVGTNLWPGYQTLYLARSLEAFERRSIKLVEMPSSTETALAFRNGSLDVAGLTLDEALNLLQYDPSLKVILVMDISMGADVLLAKPDIDSLENLKGKRVGVEYTAVGAILLQGALRAANLSIADIDLLPITFDLHESSFSEGLVDAIVTFEPVKSKLLTLGAKQLFDSSQLPGRIVDVLVTRQTLIKNYPDLLRTIVAGHFLALNYLREHPEEAVVHIAPNMALEPDQVLQQLEAMILPNLATSKQWLSGDSPTLHTSIATLEPLMREQGLLVKPIDVSRLIDDSLLPSSQESGL
ncbi:MAG: ABC transporter substrate-binding protein [Gammaproteobacteria bacterium]